MQTQDTGDNEPSDNLQEPDAAQQAKVEPIRRLRDIKAIKILIKDNPRNAALFTLGINTPLMPNELLHLKVHQVRNLTPGGLVTIGDDRTERAKTIPVNRISVLAIQALLETDTYGDDDFLFKSQRGNLVVPSLHRLITKWCKSIGLVGNFGSHTLRKTWGFHQNHSFGVEVSRLTKIFNHSSQKQTRDYLCIEEPEETDIFLNEL
ncbi:tyrosine-type recombinase/integrase [Desulfobotulus sp. H1]|uniref:Tyrosine-type recombinase/integrase n=1 Tax=Desulfobotulus pelophilus TaxID=2823377 RepID=A0ABT3N808_9BACT|nr:tyrosine-type recombinase/integrase [Desulfobotulus pelophilus]MCW7753593.1 tyrosine-type recombinase/integrase [Desulfobotulus pelophilus]